MPEDRSQYRATQAAHSHYESAPAEAVEAAAQEIWEPNEHDDAWVDDFATYDAFLSHKARTILEAAAPHMLSHEREQTRLAHLDAMVNRETKQAELAAAWDDGHLMGWNEATANTLPERDSLWRNPYRTRPTDAR